MNDNLVSVKNVSVEFDYQENFLSKKQKIHAVKNVSLNIKKKSFLGLVGESGSGKTTLGKAILGALIVAAAASSASSSDSYDYNYGPTVAATVGASLLVSAVGDARQAKVHESTINEVSKSFDGEIAPQVVEMEGLQVKLEGNIQNQFDQWQTILADIYESESSQTNEFEIL